MWPSIVLRSFRSNAESTLATKASINPASGRTTPALQSGPLGHKLKSQPVINQGEAPQGQDHAPTEVTGHFWTARTMKRRSAASGKFTAGDGSDGRGEDDDDLVDIRLRNHERRRERQGVSVDAIDTTGVRQ